MSHPTALRAKPERCSDFIIGEMSPAEDMVGNANSFCVE